MNISHALGDVLRLSDDIVVLRDEPTRHRLLAHLQRRRIFTEPIQP